MSLDDPAIISRLKKKLRDYKYLDSQMGRSNFNNLDIDEFMTKIKRSMKCCHCGINTTLDTRHRKDRNQLTLDRLNTDAGHTNRNTRVSCLGCNEDRTDGRGEK